VQPVAAGAEAQPIRGLHEGARIRNAAWSPDGRHVAFTLDHDAEVALYVAEVARGEARRLSGRALNAAAAMPIVGEGNEEPNDRFVEQLVANAEALIAEGVRRGVLDPDRVAVGGHSYGAFMTANLLAYTRLFRAGIARSGAYNRTLTPFGFQAEDRTYWEAPEVYNTMSPFQNAHRIADPILLIHGAADNNSGTFPIQSERLYAAISGLGGTARLVMLPHESHGYRARESVLHMLWETDR